MASPKSTDEMFAGATELFAIAPTALCVTQDRVVRACNPEFERMFGYSAGELAGKPTRQYFVSEAGWRESGKMLVEQAVRDGFAQLELQLKHKDGRALTVVCRARLIDAARPAAGLLCAMVDITEHQEQARRLHERNLERRALIEASAHGVVLVRERHIVHASDRGAEIFGYTPVELTGRSTRVLFGSDEDYENLGNFIYSALAKDGRFEGETRFRKKDGTTIWVRVNAVPIDQNDLSKGLAASHVDLTEWHDKEEALRAAVADREALMAAVPTSVAIVRDGKIVRCNRRGEELFGYAPGEMLGKPLAGFYISKQDFDTKWESFKAVLASDGMSEREIELRRRDGSLVWCLASARYLDTNRPEAGVIVSHIDISGRKRDEALLRAAKEHAEAASRAKSQFVANMSHEIRTPMNGVLGMTELLLETPLADEQRRFVETVYSSARSLLGIINDILDFSKIEAGKLELEATVFSPREIAEDVCALLAPRAHQKNLEVVCDIAPSVAATVVGDPARLRQVLTNLVGNAVKFTERGEIRVSVAEAAGHIGYGLRFTVADTGIGIDHATQQRLFTAFSQADASTTRRFGGSGLGLAISRQLVDLMGGTLDIDSTPGVGTRFSFALNFPRYSRAAIGAPAGHGRRVLVIIPSEPLRGTVQRQLLAWDFDVVAVADVPNLPRAASERRFDFLVCDETTGGPSLLATHAARSAVLVLLVAQGMQRQSEVSAHNTLWPTIRVPKSVRQAELLNAFTKTAATEPAVKPADATADAHRTIDRLLVVDDNPVNRTVAKSMLRGLARTIDEASDGAAALQRLAAARYDIVLMDCQMPVMDGYQATAQIRAERLLASTGQPLPVIAVTANAMAGERERCLAAGFDDYLAKPFRKSELLALVERWAGTATTA